MNFDSEAELVAVYRRYLQARGIQTRIEVPCGMGGFRADLVSSTVVWEAKLYLDRDGLYQALGQVESYREFLKLPKSAIFGLSPKRGAVKAQRQSEWLKQRHSHLWINFVDTDPAFVRFCERYQDQILNNIRSESKCLERSTVPTRST